MTKSNKNKNIKINNNINWIEKLILEPLSIFLKILAVISALALGAVAVHMLLPAFPMLPYIITVFSVIITVKTSV